jgi:hypothetical protein
MLHQFHCSGLRVLLSACLSTAAIFHCQATAPSLKKCLAICLGRFFASVWTVPAQLVSFGNPPLWLLVADGAPMHVTSSSIVLQFQFHKHSGLLENLCKHTVASTILRTVDVLRAIGDLNTRNLDDRIPNVFSTRNLSHDSLYLKIRFESDQVRFGFHDIVSKWKALSASI